MYRPLLPLLLCLSAPALADAPPAFTGEDLSGSYQCEGHDAKDGKYKATLTLTLNRTQSAWNFSAYEVKIAIPGQNGSYVGNAVADGKRLAMSFAYTDMNAHDFGTAIVAIGKDASSKVTLSKYYYQPAYKGGNYGTEECVRG